MMLISNKRCHLCERFFQKIQAQKHIQIDAMLRSGFCSHKSRSVTVPRFGFFNVLGSGLSDQKACVRDLNENKSDRLLRILDS